MPQSRSNACKELKEKINKRITGWKAKALSQAGRTVLIQTVAFALPSYYMVVYALPKAVMSSIDGRLQNF